jgi:hypothetical protein
MGWAEKFALATQYGFNVFISLYRLDTVHENFVEIYKFPIELW